MTVQQLRIVRYCILAALAYPIAAFLFFSTSIWFQLSGLLVLAAVFFLHRWTLTLMAKRLDSLAYELLDPETLGTESEEYFKQIKTFNNQAKMNGVRRYEAARRELLGEYGKALEEALAVTYGKGGRPAAASARLARYYTRSGNLKAAEELLPSCEAALAGASGDAKAALLHSLGIYKLETGSIREVGELFIEAERLEKTNLTAMNIHFDRARLAEKEGSRNDAIEHYKQAAGIGPKTWIGRESAKRAAELSSGIK